MVDARMKKDQRNEKFKIIQDEEHRGEKEATHQAKRKEASMY